MVPFVVALLIWYLVKDIRDFIARNRVVKNYFPTWLQNLMVFAIIFGMMHSYQGVSGQIITGIVGAILAVTFHLKKDDLWFNVAVHGFFDTFAIIFLNYSWL